MKKRIDIIRVLAASPGDTKAERNIISEVVSDLNGNHGRELGFRIDLIMWEDDSYPDVGLDAQDVINKQLKNYDIFIGLMSSRFGSPTHRAKSGTEEEFNRAYEKYRKKPNEIRIMFYFHNTTIKLLDIDINQIIEIHRFRERLSDLGVFYHTYETNDDFRRKLNNQLLKSVKEFIKHSGNFFDSIKKASESDKIKILNFSDWIATTKAFSPQWADHFEILLSQYSFSSFRLKGIFASESPFFRFGFKLLTKEGRLFGDGNIQSQDNNLVVHLGKNANNSELFVTTYVNGVRIGLDKPFLDYSTSKELNVEIKVNSDNLFEFIVDNNKQCEIYISQEIKQRIYLLAWGDEYEYKVTFKEIRIELQ